MELINEVVPKVSVCVVTYNHEKYIRKCLQSLVEQYTDFPFEIIVADDCSTDGTKRIVEEFASNHSRIVRSFFHIENIGATSNYLFAHAQVKGEYVAHVDGDDYALPGKLSALAAALDSNPHANIAWHRLKILNEKNGQMCDDLIDVNLQPAGGFSRSDLLACGSVGGHSASMYRAKSEFALDLYRSDLLDFFFAVERVGDGRGVWVNGFYGVYRRAVGVMVGGGQRLKRLFSDHLNYFCRKYPENRAEINSLALLLLFSDVKNMRKPATFGLFLKSLHPLAPIEFVRRLPLYRILRLPPG